MVEFNRLAALSSSSTTLETEDGKNSFPLSTPNSNYTTTFVNDKLKQIFPKNGLVNTIPSIITEDPSLNTDLSTILDFGSLVEAISLKIWSLLRTHLKQINLYQEDMERVYKAAIKAQVRSYLSWVGTALHVASIATGICSIGFTIMPGASTELCKRTAHLFGIFNFQWYHDLLKNANFDASKFAKAAIKALATGQQIFGSSSRIHDNYIGADRLTAQGSAELAKTRMEKLSKNTEECRNERNSVLQTLQQMYQQEADARKAVSR